MNINKTIIAAALFSVSSIAAALEIPSYSGSTFGSELTNTSSLNAGYYLWNDETSTRDWSLRWLGSGASNNLPEWNGSIRFYNSELASVTPYLFEIGSDPLNPQDSLIEGFDSPFLGGDDAFSWEAITNNSGGVDGIDFTLAADIETFQLSLGADIDYGIYIGASYANPDFQIIDGEKNFLIEVPEPSVLGLMGLALAGLGLARRKQA